MERTPRERPVASRAFVFALVGLELAAQILSFFTTSTLGVVKVPCLGICSPGSLESPISADSPWDTLQVFLQRLFESPPNDGEPERLEQDKSDVLLAAAEARARQKDRTMSLLPLRARATLETLATAQPGLLWMNPLIVNDLPSRLCRFTC